MIAELAGAGDEVVVGDDVYGGTYRLFERVLRDKRVAALYVDLATDPGAALRAALTERTRLVWVETPTNPLLKLIDIRAVCDGIADHRGAGGNRPLVVVDNTFASPALQRPLEIGADIVLHSATKYLGGHSDTVNGVVLTNDPAVAERLRFMQNAVGAIPGPFDCFLVLRGLRTLALRMERHSSNARVVARFLAGRPDISRVIYPGLRDGPHAHPQAALASRQMSLGGGIVSFIPNPRGDRSARERAIRICESTRLFTLAESLGGVESLIELPAVMTHASVAGSALAVPEALIRLSVGIEAPADLVSDLRQALDRA
jgi:cystathionine gamma-synthase